MVATRYNIKITEKTKRELDLLKDYPRETYDDVIAKIIFKAKTR